jgi:hypothetical protein
MLHLTPTADSPSYTNAAVAKLTGASGSQVRKLGQQLLRKPGLGTGHKVPYEFDDMLRIWVGRELLQLGISVTSLASLFAAIEPDWPRLRSGAVACLVLEVGQLGPNSHTSRAYLTTTKGAVARLRSSQTVVVIDIAEIINQLEARTGTRYA